MNRSAWLMLGCAALLDACSPKRDTPIEQEVLQIGISTDALVCHVQYLSSQENLRFHFGTYNDAFGRAATFRLIGQGFELIIITTGPGEYDITAYNLKRRPDTELMARKAFRHVVEGLNGPLPSLCKGNSGELR